MEKIIIHSNTEKAPSFENSLEGIKQYMSIAKTVSDWNELRKDSKRFFSKDLINHLDQSGYIVKLLCKNQASKQKLNEKRN